MEDQVECNSHAASDTAHCLCLCKAGGYLGEGAKDVVIYKGSLKTNNSCEAE